MTIVIRKNQKTLPMLLFNLPFLLNINVTNENITINTNKVFCLENINLIKMYKK